MADNPFDDVTIRNEATLEERTVNAGAVPFFTNSGGWVVLDSAGRKKAQQPTTPGKES